MTLTFHEDAGHGWLEVPMTEIRKLNISHIISRYSYLKNGIAYLEEDCDAQKFIQAFEKTGDRVEIQTIRERNESPIRNYPRFLTSDIAGGLLI